MSTDPALDQLSREELVARARALGARRPEVMTRVELRDEIVRLSESDPALRRRSRGWLGVARDLVASVMDAGLNMPSAAARVRGDARPAEETTGPPPVATLTLAEIYLAQGHAERALSTLEEVLATEPEHTLALALRERILSERAGGAVRRRTPASEPEREPVSVIPEPVPAPAPFVASAEPSPAASAEPSAQPAPAVSPEVSGQPSFEQPSFVASVEAPEATRHPELIPGPPDRDVEPIPPTALAPEPAPPPPFAGVAESIPVVAPAPFFGEPAPEPAAAPFFAEHVMVPPPIVPAPAPAVAAFEPGAGAPVAEDEELPSALEHSSPISQPVPTMAAPPALDDAEPLAAPVPSRAECALVARGGTVEGIYSLPPGASGVVLRVAWFVPAPEGPTGGQLDVPLDPVRTRVSLPPVESSAHIRAALGTDVAGTFHPLAVAWVYRMDAGHLSVAFSPPGEEPVHLRAELDSLAAG